MSFLITRHDGEEDDVAGRVFENYDDAYDLLEMVCGDLCCSDADYEDHPYYEIIELQEYFEQSITPTP